MKTIRLYTAGKNPVLESAFKRLQSYLAKRGKTRFVFECIDVIANPGAAVSDRVIATPTIVRGFPPEARMVGNIQDAALVARKLGLAENACGQGA